MSKSVIIRQKIYSIIRTLESQPPDEGLLSSSCGGLNCYTQGPSGPVCSNFQKGESGGWTERPTDRRTDGQRVQGILGCLSVNKKWHIFFYHIKCLKFPNWDFLYTFPKTVNFNAILGYKVKLNLLYRAVTSKSKTQTNTC